MRENFDREGLYAYYCAPMSERQVPAYVDTRKVFLQEAEITGSVALDRMPRFQESLASDSGEVIVELRFWIDDYGQRLITGKLQARVEVTCQRCLEPLAIELADDIKLALLSDESQVKALDEDLDPWICDEIKLDLAELVEEQLMLCMPIVNSHPDDTCPQRMNYTIGDAAVDPVEEGADDNPFAVLKALKNKD